MDCPILNLTSRRRTGAIRSRATLPLPLAPPLGVPTSVVVPTLLTLPTPTTDVGPCAAAAADVVDPRTGVVVATAVPEIGACCGVNSDDGRDNGVDGGILSCPGADRLGMDIGPVGLVLVGVVVVDVVGSGGDGSKDGGGKGGGGGAGDTEGEVPIRPRPVKGEGDDCRPSHRDEGVCTFVIDDGGIPPTVVVGGMCSPTCCCGSARECSIGGGGGGGGSCGGGGGVETAKGMVVECCWHDDDMLARVWSFLSVLLQASLLMESRASLRLWLFLLLIMVGVMAGLVKVRLVEVGTSLTMFSADAGGDCERGSIGLAVCLW